MRSAESPSPTNRRRVLGLLAGAAVAAPAISALAPTAAEAASVSRRNLKDYGAVGDGSHDDTAALAASVAGASDGVEVYIPAGTYKVTAFPDIPDGSRFVGDGPRLSIFLSTTPGPVLRMTSIQNVSFAALGWHVTNVTGEAVTIDGCFRILFLDCLFTGDLVPSNASTYSGQVGIRLTNNTGGVTFTSCDINNFGTGLITTCIQNYLVGCRFTTNKVGVLGTGGNASAGLTLTACEFLGYLGPPVSDAHIRVTGGANNWDITNCWFEGAQYGFDLGDSTGGPQAFAVSNTKIAASIVIVRIRSCYYPHFSQVTLDRDPGTSAQAFQISGAAQGYVSGLVCGWNSQVAYTDFPSGWHVLNRLYFRTGVVFSDTFVLHGTDGNYYKLATNGQTVTPVAIDPNSFGSGTT